MSNMPLPTSVRRALAVAVLGAALVAVALPASAHADLVSSDPADGDTVSELTSVRLEFAEELLEIGNSITVTDGAGATQDLVLSQPQPAVLEAPIGDLTPGDITIAWRNASVDGHTEEGELHVTLEAAVAEPSETPTETPSAEPSADPSSGAVVTDVATPSPSASPTAIAATESGPSPWLWGLLGLVVIGGAGAAIVAATRRPPTPPTDS
jgi:methionine-rich copper-binding protein CopC